jgi:hypothetical protein
MGIVTVKEIRHTKQSYIVARGLGAVGESQLAAWLSNLKGDVTAISLGT